MSSYTVYVTPAAHKELRKLPARFRGRIKKVIDAFADDPRPSGSKILDLPPSMRTSAVSIGIVASDVWNR